MSDTACENIIKILENDGGAFTTEEKKSLRENQGNTKVFAELASALTLKYSLRGHAEALGNAASKSEYNAAALAEYTKWLCIATVVLAAVGAVQLGVAIFSFMKW